MSGGISYVLKKIRDPKTRMKPDDNLGMGYKQAKKGPYEMFLRIRDEKPETIELVHYGTIILDIDYKRKEVEGGYHSVSSSNAINQALRAFKVPCFWTRATDPYGFWCKRPWKGDPDGEKHLKDVKERKRSEAIRRKLERPGGMLRVPGHRYSKYSRQKIAEIQEDWLKQKRAREIPPDY